jgi:hypothetical protein
MPSWPPLRGAPARGFPVKFEALKVDELARRTGLTVRPLHRYDLLGYNVPSAAPADEHGVRR